MHTVHVYLLYICAYNLHMHIYMYERNTGCTDKAEPCWFFFVALFLCRANVSCLFNLWFYISNEWRRANVEWLRGSTSKCSFEKRWWKESFWRTRVFALTSVSPLWNKSPTSPAAQKVDYAAIWQINLGDFFYFLNHFTCSALSLLFFSCLQ